MSNVRIRALLPEQKHLKRLSCDSLPDSPCHMIHIAALETDEKKLSHFEFATRMPVEGRERHYRLSSHSISTEFDPEADIDTDMESNATDDNVLEQDFDNSDDEVEASVSHCEFSSIRKLG